MTAKIILALTVGAAAVLDQGSRSVWDGVYTDAQAKRGEALFGENCVTAMGQRWKATERHLHCQVVNHFGLGTANRSALNQIRYEPKKPGTKK
jgi:hypothetical protein